MTESLEIRESLPDDLAAIEVLYPDAFPDEDLLPVVRDLLRKGPAVLSLVATADGALVGHVVFATCGIAGTTHEVALLAPLAVASARQGQGIGSALVRDGMRRMEQAGRKRVFVLGDPAYYGRFGFAPDDAVAPPYPLPEDWRPAWQSLGLRDAEPPLHGELTVPEPWRKRAYWAP